jgi:uncharacterized protein YigA (DUF484 family)
MTKELSEKEVAAYLSAHPDYFVNRDNLLLKMELPHGNKGAVSLVEKQMLVMREKQQKTRKQLNEFVASAELNKEIFDKSRSLILQLISATRRSDFFDALEKSLKRDFQCKAYSLIIFGNRPRQINHFTSRVTAASARDYVGSLMKAKEPTLGVLRSEEQDFLFRHQSEKVKSAAVLSVKEKNKQLALLAIGSADPHYFASDMDTLFLSFIADTLAKLLPRHLPR